MRKKLFGPPGPPLEAARSFLRTFFSDALNFEEAISEVESMARTNAKIVQRGLQGIESLLEQELEPETLSVLVAIDANYPLDEPSDAGTRIWLHDLAQTVRDILKKVS